MAEFSKYKKTDMFDTYNNDLTGVLDLGIPGSKYGVVRLKYYNTDTAAFKLLGVSDDIFDACDLAENLNTPQSILNESIVGLSHWKYFS